MKNSGETHLHHLIELVRWKNIFRWDRKKIGVKLISAILYYAGISLRKTSKFLRDFEWYYVWTSVANTWEILGIMVTKWRTLIDIIKVCQ